MGYKTREYDSLPLAGRYPSYYEELQILNFTSVDVVVTRPDGSQKIVTAWPHSSSLRQLVTIQHREHTGVREETTRLGSKQKPISTTDYSVELSKFSLHPTRVPELNLIISTVEMSVIAKNMAVAEEYSPTSNDYLSDFETYDPRFVFEVKDPFNRWECLYLSVMGQTVTLRCGHKNQVIVDLDGAMPVEGEAPTLSCYLRYPSNAMCAEGTIVPMFTIDLTDIDREEPYVLASGDTVCIAESIEGLKRVLSKRHLGGTSTGVKINSMISKEVHEQIVQKLKDQLEEEKRLSAEKVRASEIKSKTRIAELESKTSEQARTIDVLERQNKYWSSIHEGTVERNKREDALEAQREKYRHESISNMHKENEQYWDLIKIGASALAGLASFAITTIIKSSKK